VPPARCGEAGCTTRWGYQNKPCSPQHYLKLCPKNKDFFEKAGPASRIELAAPAQPGRHGRGPSVWD